MNVVAENEKCWECEQVFHAGAEHEVASNGFGDTLVGIDLDHTFVLMSIGSCRTRRRWEVRSFLNLTTVATTSDFHVAEAIFRDLTVAKIVSAMDAT